MKTNLDAYERQIERSAGQFRPVSKEKVQLISLHAAQAFISEAEMEQSLPWSALRQPLAQKLPEKGRFARAPHADHRDRLAGYWGDPRVAPGKPGQRRGYGIDDFVAQQLVGSIGAIGVKPLLLTSFRPQLG